MIVYEDGLIGNYHEFESRHLYLTISGKHPSLKFWGDENIVAYLKPSDYGLAICCDNEVVINPAAKPIKP
jgi:hypothetical protein